MRSKKPTISIMIAVSLLILALPVLSALSIYAKEGDPVTVTVDGTPIAWEGVLPCFINGRLMVPVGQLGKALDAQTVWLSEKQEVFVYLSGRYAWLQVSNPTMYYGTYALSENGEYLLTELNDMALDARPHIEKGRVLAPLAALMDVLGGSVTWDASASTALVTPPPAQIAPVIVKAAESNQQDGQPYLAPVAPSAIATDSETDFFQMLTWEELTEKYESDEPFVLVCFDSGIHRHALEPALTAAGQLSLKIYGYDGQNKNKSALPFGEQQGGGKWQMVIIAGYEQVTVLEEPDYASAYDALKDYWAIE